MTSQIIALARLGRATDTEFTFEPDAEARADIAQELSLRGLKKVRLTGNLRAVDRYDWHLTARLGATAVQECVVTLDPVTTRIDKDVVRNYLADLPEPTEEDFEIPEDDTIEALPKSLDLRELLIEALALALPDFPRAPGVELGQAVFAAPGVRPMSDEDAKPLAGLAALRDKLGDGENGPENEG